MAVHKRQQNSKKTAKTTFGRTARRKNERANEQAEILALEARLQQPIEHTDRLRLFRELPISNKTLSGLNRAAWVEMTEIQRAALPLSLAGKDVLGAAKTGSGKTLAFIIPVLEYLYRLQWNPLDGLGALIISPTRELALQIFEVLKKAGSEHSFSAGLIIGGKDLKDEQDRVFRMNILVATPGRLLQHMDETPLFDCNNLKILVLDEADRILDMGFANTINAIIDNLPSKRQTLLFSATQTKSVSDLARLSLKDPEYVAVHEKATEATPQALKQHYVECELHDKLNILFSFIRTHLTSKILVFLSSCKQARFVYEAFRKMRPGIPVMTLHGKQKQPKRMAIFLDFCQRQHAVMFATDIAARGLDFPAIDWVLQVDAPEDVETYIHRVGRTARYNAQGQALLMLLPSEANGMIQLLTAKKVPINRIEINPSKTVSIQRQLEAICSQNPEIKYLAQKAFVSYMRSVYLRSNKAIFDVAKLPAEEFASSLGLPGAPKIKFVKKAAVKALKNQSRSVGLDELSDSSDDDEIDNDVNDDEDDEDEENEEEEEEDSEDEQNPQARKMKPKKLPSTKMQRMFKRRNQDALSDHQDRLRDGDDNDDNDNDGDDLLVKKNSSSSVAIDDDDSSIDIMAGLSKKKQALLTKKKFRIKIGERGTKTFFDDDGEAHGEFEFDSDANYRNKPAVQSMTSEYLEEQRGKMKQEDEADKEVQRARLRARRLKKKLQQKEKLKGETSDDDDDDEVTVTLGRPDERSDEEEEHEKHKQQLEQGKRKLVANLSAAKRAKLALINPEELALKLLQSN